MTDTFTPRTKEEISTDPQPGDVFVSSWGYDQTNACFYVVTKRTPGGVWVVPVGRKVVNGRVYPDPSDERPRKQWSEKTLTYGDPRPEFKRFQPGPHACLRFSTFEFAFPYTGGGAYDTIAAGLPGH